MKRGLPTADNHVRVFRRSDTSVVISLDYGLAASILVAAFAAVALATAGIFRHDRYGSNAFDLGIYDQSIWGYSRLHLALDNTVLRTPNLVGNHFQPILFGLVPFEWLWSDPRMLLVAQAVLLASAGIPIFIWARTHLGDAAAVIFQAAYLIFWGVLGGDIYDFHEVAFAAPIVAVALYALLERRRTLLAAMLVLLLLTKEDLGLTVAAFGLYLAIVQRAWRFGAIVITGGLAWTLAMIKLVIPAISGERYVHWFYGALGSGPGDAAKNLVVRPVESVKVFFTPREKRVALFDIFASWLFLPLFSPLLIVMLPTLAERFFSDKPAYWSQGFHYSIVISPMLAFAAVDTTRRAHERFRPRPNLVPAAVGCAVLAAGVYFSFGRLKPLDELRRYTSAQHAAQIDACLAKIPGSASVAATSALVPHLSQRRRIWVLDRRGIPQTDVYAIDTYTWMYPFTLADVRRLLDAKLGHGYGVTCTGPGTVVVVRGAQNTQIAPQLRTQIKRT